MPMKPPLHRESLLLEDSGRRDSFLEDFQCCAALEMEVDKKAEDRPSDTDTDGADSAMKDESEDSLNRGNGIDGIGTDHGKTEQDGKFICPALKLIRSFRGSPRRN